MDPGRDVVVELVQVVVVRVAVGPPHVAGAAVIVAAHAPKDVSRPFVLTHCEISLSAKIN